jgi:F-type H+-transporting ATPase subunit c
MWSNFNRTRLSPPFLTFQQQPQYPKLHSPSSIPLAIIMNSIAQLAARSARLNGASALRQANPIARRGFTNGNVNSSTPSAKQ